LRRGADRRKSFVISLAAHVRFWRRSVLRTLFLSIGLVVPALIVGGAAHSAQVTFDRFDGSGFTDDSKGYVRFFLDVVDQDDQVIDPREITDVRVYVQNQLIEGRWEMRHVSNENPVSVAILIAAHEAYAWTDDPERDDSVIMEQMKAGYRDVLEGLTDGVDWSTVWFYNEEAVSRASGWSQRHQDAISRLGMVKRGAKGLAQAPMLYAHIERVMKDIVDSVDTLSQRRLLVIMSDGKDRFLERASLLESRIGNIVTSAEEANVKVMALGMSLDIPEPLVHLQTLSQRTGGSYRDVRLEEVEDIRRAIRLLGDRIKKQYVLEFRPTSYRGPDGPVNVRIELVTQRGAAQTAVDIAGWEKKPFNWMVIVIWALVIIGSLLGIFLIIKLFKWMAARRANRPVYVEEDEEYVGPYKGKLTCMAGAYAGQEFFLTEDVTTIGSIDGNTIVIQDAGVSKRHAGVKIEEMRFELADFGSTNGTYVNGSKITKQFLRDQDKIKIGECELRFSLK